MGDLYQAFQLRRKNVEAVASVPDDVARGFLNEIVTAVLKQIPKPKDGKSVDFNEVVVAVLARVPKPKDGKSVDFDAVVEAVAARVPKPRDGVSPDFNKVVEEVAKRIPKPSAPKPVDTKKIVDSVLKLVPKPEIDPSWKIVDSRWMNGHLFLVRGDGSELDLGLIKPVMGRDDGRGYVATVYDATVQGGDGGGSITVYEQEAEPADPNEGDIWIELSGITVVDVYVRAPSGWVSLGAAYTDEQAQDAVGAMVSGNTEDGVSVTYDDGTNKLNFANTDKGSEAVSDHEGAADPHPQYLTAAEGAAAFDSLGAADAVATDLSDHIADTSAAHAASAISFTPGSGIDATDVQAAIEEAKNDVVATYVTMARPSSGTPQVGLPGRHLRLAAVALGGSVQNSRSYTAFKVDKTITVIGLTCEVTTQDATPLEIRMGIVAADSNLQPTGAMLGEGSASTAGVGVKTVTLGGGSGITLTPGWYLTGFCTNSSVVRIRQQHLTGLATVWGDASLPNSYLAPASYPTGGNWGSPVTPWNTHGRSTSGEQAWVLLDWTPT